MRTEEEPKGKGETAMEPGLGHNGGPALGDDLLRGMKAIAQFIGEEERRAYYLAEKQYIPVGKEGDGRYIASKRRLRAHYDRITGGA